MTSNYWSNKRVVVTGGAGMIGSRLCEFLYLAGARVHILDNMSRGKTVDAWCTHAQFPYDDATKLYMCKRAFRDMDVVFNLAASVGGVYHNLSHQAEQYKLNHDLQTVPVMAAAQCRVPVFVQTSSVCVYSAKYNSPACVQNGLLGSPEPANEGYAWAKRMGEYITHWAFTSDTRHMIVRPTNCYGINDYFDSRAHVIPALIRKFSDRRLASDSVDVYGGDQTREFIYADDVARGMMVVAEKGRSGRAYNLGTHGKTVIRIATLARMIREGVDSQASINFVNDRPTGDRQRSTDCTETHELGWEHGVCLGEGLDRVIEWYQERNNNEKAS